MGRHWRGREGGVRSALLLGGSDAETGEDSSLSRTE